MRSRALIAGMIIPLVCPLASCRDALTTPEARHEASPARTTRGTGGPGPFVLSPAAFDIVAAPDGSLLAVQNATVREIRKGGVQDVIDVPTVPGSALNGVEATGRGGLFVTSAGLDLALGAGVWHVSHGGVRLIGDVEAFETQYDPDAFAGPMWKHQACEEDSSQGFSAGPQSNPYHLASLSGNTALVADAAGNTVLSATTAGEVDWVAVFTPPVDESGAYRFLKTAESDPTIDCYVQPVPTSVAVGPDGAYYVGELTGAPAVPGWSRVWRIERGARHTTCPSSDCQEVLSDLTSIIDVEFGPDGALYVVEYDVNGWLAALLGNPGGGTVQRCDVSVGTCQIVEAGLPLPSAITFDKWGDLWLLENNIVAPKVRKLALP